MIYLLGKVHNQSPKQTFQKRIKLLLAKDAELDIVMRYASIADYNIPCVDK